MAERVDNDWHWKALLGKGLIAACTAAPGLRPRLRRLGLRTRPSWCGSRPLRVRAPDGGYLKLASVRQNYLSFQLFWLGMGYYEPETAILLGGLLEERPCFVDIGANIGFYTLLAARAQPGIQVAAFEPNPRLFALLAANVEANGFRTVRCEQLALSSRAGRACLHLSGSDMGASLEDVYASPLPGGEIEVEVCALDDYLRDRGIDGPLVLKVDVEGHEEAVLAGAGETLSGRRPDLILEVARSLGREPYPVLGRLGYRYYRIADGGLERCDRLEPTIRGQLWFSNYLCSARPASEIERLSELLRTRMAGVRLAETSCHVDAAKLERLAGAR